MRLSDDKNVIDSNASVHPDALVEKSIIIGRAALGANCILRNAIYSYDGLNNNYLTEVRENE